MSDGGKKVREKSGASGVSGVSGDSGSPERGKTYGETVDAAAEARAQAEASSPASAAAAHTARPARPAYGEYATPDEQRAAIRVPLDSAEGVPVVADAAAGVVVEDAHAGPSAYGERVAGAQRPHDSASTTASSGASSGSVGSSRPSSSSSPESSGSSAGRDGSSARASKSSAQGFFAKAFAPASQAESTGAATQDASGDAPVVRRDRLLTYVLLAFGLLSTLQSAAAIGTFPATARDMFEQLDMTVVPSASMLSTIGWATAIAHIVLWVIALLWSLRAIRRGKLSWWIPVVCTVILFIVMTIAVVIVFFSDPSLMADLTQNRP